MLLEEIIFIIYKINKQWPLYMADLCVKMVQAKCFSTLFFMKGWELQKRREKRHLYNKFDRLVKLKRLSRVNLGHCPDPKQVCGETTP